MVVFFKVLGNWVVFVGFYLIWVYLFFFLD